LGTIYLEKIIYPQFDKAGVLASVNDVLNEKGYEIRPNGNIHVVINVKKTVEKEIIELLALLSRATAKESIDEIKQSIIISLNKLN
jgi:predicted amino acid-binding ACT domain protein